jgi:Flp pilus assembly pilin Flp
MKSLIARFVREEEGQDLIEYAMLATLIALAAGVGAQLLGDNLLAWYNAMAGRVEDWSAEAGGGA